MATRKTTKAAKKKQQARTYTHSDQDALMRPEVGTQAQFRKDKRKPPAKYHYDSSLSPALDWDGQHPAREAGDALIRRILDAPTLAEAKAAAEELKRLGKPFLNWAGKAERLSFDVPTLPLFIHERLSTKAILETLARHRKDQQTDMFDLFGDPKHSITDQVLRAYEYKDQWVNRMILGDSLVVMNSLLHYEGMGGQVQMIYIDPPYGVKFGSNFQPFIKKRDVSHNDDADMTREPEMVQAYRDTWELGLHSYLTYLRDRLLLARELLTPSGSVFVQISDENLHHVREVMDEVFGGENFVAIVVIQKTASATSELIASTPDFIIWFARDKDHCKYRPQYTYKFGADGTLGRYDQVELINGLRRPLTPEEKSSPDIVPLDARRFQLSAMTSSRPPGDFPVEFAGKTFTPRTGYWKTGREGMHRLIASQRLAVTAGGTLRYVRYAGDFPFQEVDTLWTDISGGVQSRSDPKVYVVQTSTSVIQRCLLMTTDPGDLVLDPTCGSGTTAYVAEQWGRRWITIDTSRVPLALARQRLLTATFPWYDLKDDARGPAGGFVYKRKQNAKGEEVGGIVPHVTLKSIANAEPPAEEVLVDRPEIGKSITRVTGPFCVEATIPTPVDWDGDGVEDSGMPAEEYGSFVERMIEILRRSPVLRLEGNRIVTFKNVRPPARSLSLSAEAMVEASAAGQHPSLADVIDEAEEKRGDRLASSMKPVAFVFGPENGAVSEKLVHGAIKEANLKGYTHLYVIGFAIQPNARELIEHAEQVGGIPATYVQATPDLLMGDLLKNMRSSQIFSVCGLPEVEIRKVAPKDKGEPVRYQASLLGLDVFDPVTMENTKLEGSDIPAWLLDTDYNGRCFRVTQAFFPKTEAWESLKKALKADFEESVWDHLRGTTSAPFDAQAGQQVAVKVIDNRGNELMVVKTVGEK